MVNTEKALSSTTALPAKPGLSLKAQHFDHIINDKPDIAWFEIHPENYMGDGGSAHNNLTKIREDYPLSMHSVGLSLGSADGLDSIHLNQLCNLIERYEPAQISDHVSWSRTNGQFLNDLLPIPYTQECIDVFVRNIETVQEKTQRKILIENPSVYLEFSEQDFSEGAFIDEICTRSGCGLLLDINNIFVSATNQKNSPLELLNGYNLDTVEEMHLAGHATTQLADGSPFYIDDHGSPVCTAVWALYKEALEKLNRPVATLIEWDTDVPDFTTLQAEASKARKILDSLYPR